MKGLENSSDVSHSRGLDKSCALILFWDFGAI